MCNIVTQTECLEMIKVTLITLVFRGNNLHVEGSYLNNKLHGAYKKYHPNKQLEIAVTFDEGITAPEIMLLPYIRGPATGSRMPSMSTRKFVRMNR